MEFNGQYLTYNEYKELGGNLDQTPFNLLEFEAQRIIDNRTQNRLKGVENLPQEVKMCMFNLINNINNYSSINNEVNRNIASESVGSYSVSYVTGNQIAEIVKSKATELNDLVLTYLTGVIVNNEHIIYLGVK